MFLKPEIVSISRDFFNLLRPKQWIKNCFVLAPLVFSGKVLNSMAIDHAFFAVILFCFASSAAYIINDIRDIEYDRQHPKKRFTRPLANGALKLSHAISLLIIVYALLGLGCLQFPALILPILAYLIINIAYTWFFKNQPVIDIFTIATGFVLRVYTGAVAIAVPLSSWMLITTLCLALYLASIKRKQELLQSGSHSRKILAQYSVDVINRFAELSAVCAIIFYSLYVLSVKPNLVISIPFVLFGIFRYWFIVEMQGDGESPTDALLSDWQLILTIIIWIGVILWTSLPRIF